MDFSLFRFNLFFFRGFVVIGVEKFLENHWKKSSL